MPATVTGRLTNSALTALASADFTITVVRLDDPQGTFLQATTTHTTDGSGNFSVSNLFMGLYELKYGNEVVSFRVPKSSGSFSISNILDSLA